MPTLVRAALLAVLAGLGGAAPAWADPALTVKLRNTAEAWRNVRGGLAVGDTGLDKLQVNPTLDGGAFGAPGFKAHAALFKTNRETLSGSRTGDLQTASNIEAEGGARLFELWASQSVGRADVRVGLLDLNDTFDSIDPAGLFLNSSHGVGPDLAESGRNGPSIFPVSSLGLQLGWTASPALSLHAAVLDGVPGDPAHPRRFVDVRLSRADGALLIAELDRSLPGDGQASLGVWKYTAGLPSVARPDRTRDGRPGVYASVQGPVPLPGRPRGWLRAGVADGRVQRVSGYLGAGVVWPAPWRPGDSLGLAVAHAVISPSARRAQGLPHAETAWEATYSLKVGKVVHLQPDVQYIVRPAGGPGLRNALAVGLRVIAEIDWSGG